MRRSIVVGTSIVAIALMGVAACGPPPMGGGKPGPKPPGGGNPAAGAPSGGSASNGPGGPADAGSSGGGGVTTFRVLCGSSHVAPDDPIVQASVGDARAILEHLGARTFLARLDELTGEAAATPHPATSSSGHETEAATA